MVAENFLCFPNMAQLHMISQHFKRPKECVAVFTPKIIVIPLLLPVICNPLPTTTEKELGVPFLALGLGHIGRLQGKLVDNNSTRMHELLNVAEEIEVQVWKVLD